MSSSEPFTYLVGWSCLNAYYYGVRYGASVNPKTLWTTYFTSSSFVHDFWKANGEPDVISIRRTFSDSMAARAWEVRVLRRMKVVARTDFLNRSDKPSPPSRLGALHSESSISKMKKPMAEDRKKNISKAVRGKNQKQWLIKTPETEFCIQSLDYLSEQKIKSLYCSFRNKQPITRGRLKGWSLTQIQDVII